MQSRKVHGATTFDLEIDVEQPVAGEVTVEPRSGAAGHQVVFQFNAPISVAGSVTVVDANANPVGSASVSAAANEVIVSLGSIPDAARITVSMTGVNGSGAASASIAFLLGDVRASRTVTSGDILPTKARAGQAANAANFLCDVDLNGTIGASDLLAVKARAGGLIP